MPGFHTRRKKRLFWVWVSLILIAIALIVYGATHDNLILSAIVPCIPLGVFVVLWSFEKPLVSFLILFVFSYMMPVMTHYIPNAPLGVMTDMLILFSFLVFLSQHMMGDLKVDHLTGWPILFVLIWLIYCTLEVYNPRMLDINAWMSSIRNMALYFFLLMFVVQLSTRTFEEEEEIIFIWSILTIIAGLKAFYQQFIGWTPGDKYFLTVMDGARTHIIGYGTRYFSIFTDAANFGGSMGLSCTVFGALGLNTKSKGKRFYYWIIAAIALYGVFISGTRSALVVPAAGILLYVVLMRNWKIAIPIVAAMVIVVCVLAFTDVGGSSTAIRRAKTVFHKDQDESYVVRKENQKRLRKLMEDLPFGNSLKMSGGRGSAFGDKSEINSIPTDSWYVQLWVETGRWGQLIYFTMMLYLFISGGIVCFFKLKDPMIRGTTAALLSGVVGLFIMSSNNEVFTQYPNGILVYTSIALIAMSQKLEQEHLEQKQEENPEE